MARYVDLDAIIETLELEWGYEGMRETLYELPAIEAEPVRHGRWITDSLLTTCSECQRSFNDLPMFAHYCPNCGAKMDKENDNG